VGRDENHRHLAASLAQAAAGVVAAEAGHLDVEEHGVELRRGGEEGFAVGEFRHRVFPFQQADEDHALGGVVFDDGDAVLVAHDFLLGIESV
jgi:hypothetical protein